MRSDQEKMVNVKPLEQAASKWSSRASSAQEEYAQAVMAADWRSAAASDTAEANYQAGIQAAIARKARAKGVQAISNEEWRQTIQQKGKANFGTGVLAEVSKSKWMKKWKPYGDVLKSLTLDARGARGAPGNYERVKKIGTALHDAKVGAAK
jgi:hypothetical protein